MLVCIFNMHALLNNIGENVTARADESDNSESNESQSDSQNVCTQPESVSGIANNLTIVDKSNDNTIILL